MSVYVPSDLDEEDAPDERYTWQCDSCLRGKYGPRRHFQCPQCGRDICELCSAVYKHDNIYPESERCTGTPSIGSGHDWVMEVLEALKHFKIAIERVETL